MDLIFYLLMPSNHHCLNIGLILKYLINIIYAGKLNILIFLLKLTRVVQRPGRGQILTGRTTLKNYLHYFCEFFSYDSNVKKHLKMSFEEKIS